MNKHPRLNMLIKWVMHQRLMRTHHPKTGELNEQDFWIEKITADNVICRTTASDGEVARDVEISLMEDKNYTVLAAAETVAAGTYNFKATAPSTMSWPL